MPEQQRDLSVGLLEVAQTLTTNLDLSVVLPTILDQLARLVSYDSASIMLLEGELLRPVAQRSIFSLNSEPLTIHQHELTHIQAVLAARTPVLIADTEDDVRWISRPGSTMIRCWLGVPLIANNQVIGLLNLSHHTADHFDDHSTQTTGAFAAFAAIALNNAALVQRLQRELAERTRVENELRQERAHLAGRIAEQTSTLRAANQEMAQASRMKDEFLAAMSHELHTPLNTIISMTDILLEETYGALTDRQHRALSAVSSSSKHLLSIIHDVLDVARIESGKLQLLVQEVEVDHLCRVCLGQIIAAEKKQRVTYTIDPSITTIIADERRLRQILLNLLSNAVKFTAEGGAIGLDVQRDEEHDCLMLTVWDTGIGIDESDLHRLFRPFVQLDSSLSRRYEGTGLGLTIVHRLTALHGGSLVVESRKGAGSRFTVRLPRQAVLDKSDDGPALPSDHHPFVLIVAGLDRASDLLVSHLRTTSHRVEVMLQGADDSPIIGRPDLVIINSHLFSFNIVQTLHNIRKSALLNSAPIVVLSALHLPGDREAALAGGADAYCTKPLSKQEFDQLIALCHA